MNSQCAKEKLLQEARTASEKFVEYAPWMALGAFGLGVALAKKPKAVCSCCKAVIRGLRSISGVMAHCKGAD